MLTDQQLIERIRTAMGEEVAGLHPRADLLERLQSAPAAHRRRSLRVPSGVGSVVALLASTAVVVMVVATFLSLEHSTRSTGAAPRVPAGTPAAARALVARLAVLRRPQTAADHLPAPVIAQAMALNQHVIKGLSRLAATVNGVPGVHGPVEVYVVVVKSGGYPVDLVTTLEVGGPPSHRRLLYSPDVVDGQTATATGGLSAGAVGSNLTNQGNSGLNVSVVPDGVSRVQWAFALRPAQGAFRACRIAVETRRIQDRRTCIQTKLTWFAKAPRMTVHPTVENNVAVSIATPSQEGLFSASWYGAGGRVLASFNALAHQHVEDARALAISGRQPTAAALIEHFSIFRRPVPHPATIKQLPRRVPVAVAGMGYGLNVTQSRFVPYPGTTGLWAIPGASGISILSIEPVGDSGGGGDNDPVARALSGRVSMSTCCSAGRETVWGLVPDGNRTVTALLAGRATRTVPVIDNVYSVTAKHKVVFVIAKDAAGRPVKVRAGG